MVISPNIHRRVVHMRMSDWFFTSPNDSQPSFCPLPLEPENHSQALLQYLADRKVVENEEYTNLTPYIFTVNDVRFLLINRFDLTTLHYLVHDVSYNEYEKLYNIAYVNKLPLTSLHGLQVDFSQNDAMSHLDDLIDEFVSEQTPVYLKHIIIELSELKNIAKNPKYHDFFSKNDLHLTISYDEGEHRQQKTTIDTKKFHDAMACDTVTTLRSFSFFQEKTNLISQIRNLSNLTLNVECTLSNDISKGELLLSAMVCTFIAKRNQVKRLVWETQITKEPPAEERACSESDITLLSKIRNC